MRLAQYLLIRTEDPAEGRYCEFALMRAIDAALLADTKPSVVPEEGCCVGFEPANQMVGYAAAKEALVEYLSAIGHLASSIHSIMNGATTVHRINLAQELPPRVVSTFKILGVVWHQDLDGPLLCRPIGPYGSLLAIDCYFETTDLIRSVLTPRAL